MTAKIYKRGFTLFELMIVVVILVILAAIALVTYSGIQAMARDSERKSDLQAIGSAYKLYYQDTKSWSITGPNEQGYFNKVGMGAALVAQGYMSSAPRDPLIPDNNTEKTSTATQYMKYLCYASGGGSIPRGIIMFAHIEKLSTQDSSDYTAATSSCYTSGGQRVSDYYGVSGLGINYAATFN